MIPDNIRKGWEKEAEGCIDGYIENVCTTSNIFDTYDLSSIYIKGREAQYLADKAELDRLRGFIEKAYKHNAAATGTHLEELFIDFKKSNNL